MYLLVPTAFILTSLCGILYILWKKMPYLKNLSAGESQIGYSFWEELFPEIFNYLKKIDLSIHKQAWMKEFEKFVRRLHIISLKLDNFTNSLLYKIRTKNGELKNGTKNIEFEKTDRATCREVIKNPKQQGNYC